METKSAKPSVSGLLLVSAGLLIVGGNAGSVLAANARGWNAVGEPSTPPKDLETIAVENLHGYVILPLFSIGVAVFVLWFLYRIGKRDPRGLGHLRKLGKPCLTLSALTWVAASYVVGPFLQYGSNAMMMVGLIAYCLIWASALVLYILAAFYVWEYLWMLIGGVEKHPQEK